MPDHFVPQTPAAAVSAMRPSAWRARVLRHRERVEQWTGPRRERRARGDSHPVYDFLFQYYSYSAGQLEVWHPAPHEALIDTPEAREHFAPPVYQAADGVIRRDTRALSAGSRAKLTSVIDVMTATRDRPANFSCYGMHEWAMVYRGHDVRHVRIAPPL